MNPGYAEVDLSQLSKRDLWSNAMKGKWQKVIAIYREDTAAHTAKVSKSGDTALHMAISDFEESTVEKLVQIVDKTALETKNKLGNTPLHMAAYVGSVRMCRWIATKDSKLIGIQNKITETPFFLAAVHGRKDAFLCMHQYLCKEVDQVYRYGRRSKDGRTILHSAIDGEHFDLAFQIINLYPELIHSVDEMGLSPLHILASKPSAFKSGVHLSLLDELIYNRVTVKKLNYPENSQTSFNILHRLGNYISRAPRGRRSVLTMDAEDPNGRQLDHQQGQGRDFVLKKHATCLDALKALILAILGLREHIQVRKIREEKKKHTWAIQTMEKLLEESSLYDYEYGGKIQNDGEKKSSSYAIDHGIANVRLEQIPTESESMVDDDPNQGTTIGDGKPDKAMENDKKEALLLMAAKLGIIENVGKMIEPFGLAIQDKNNSDDEIEKIKAKALIVNVKKESPLLIAAKHGITELVEGILDKFPVAIYDTNIDGKNIVLLAVENRQPHVYKLLLNHKIFKETIFYQTDNDGNSALHVAANMGDRQNWNIPGPALQMQWEVKWYEFVEKSMPSNFFVPENKLGTTSWHIFRETHQQLVKDAGEWLNKTSESCSIVATLIATVAFTASATIPGGVRSESGTPVLEKQPAFSIFAISALIALCFSISSVVMFLVFFTSRYRERDFGASLPKKLLVELTSLLLAIAAVLVSFCSAHFFVVKDQLKYTALPLYAITLLPVALYAFWQFPMYFELAVATFTDEPQKIYE